MKLPRSRYHTGAVMKATKPDMTNARKRCAASRFGRSVLIVPISMVATARPANTAGRSVCAAMPRIAPHPTTAIVARRGVVHGARDNATIQTMASIAVVMLRA